MERSICVPLTTINVMMSTTFKDLGYASYCDYLRSEHWQSFRKRFFSTSAIARKLRQRFGELRCQFCFASGVLHLHHRTYKRLGKERLDDVVLICADCHNEAHKRHEKRKDKGLWSATKRTRKQKRRQLRRSGVFE